MKILCATDFSEPATVAARAAASLAARTREPLQLAHVVPLPDLGSVERRPDDPDLARARVALPGQAQELHKLGCKVVEHVLEGPADEAVIGAAQKLGVELIVIGPRGEHRGSPWSLGSLAMSLIKGAHVPVLVVRDERSLAAWAKGERALRVLTGLDRTPQSRTALQWTRELEQLGRIELVAGHVYSPAEAGRRYSAADEIDPQRDIRHIESALAGELGPILATATKPAPRLKLLAGWGRVSYHLLDLIESERADLLVIGTHRRHGLERLWRGSVSLDLAAHARCNVLTVPTAAAEPRPPRADPREIRRVLVPCDLSENSARAIAWACSLLARGGTLHLLHVSVPFVPLAPDFGGMVPLAPPTAEELAKEAAALERKLRALVPADATEREIEAKVEIVTAFDAATTIVQAAERAQADVICLTTHGRSGLSRALMGSVAESVLRHSHVPLLVLTPR